MESCIYEGVLEHRRLAPVPHEFRYPLYLMHLDLDELPSLFRGRLFWSAARPAWARFRRSDYPGHPSEPLGDTIRGMVEASTGRRPEGPVRLLTQLRHLGIGFNPVSFFYCYAAGAEQLEAVVAHVTSTPWSETHSYVVTHEGPRRRGGLRGHAAKKLHVSPFLPMDLRHEFRFDKPGERLRAQVTDRRAGDVVFTAGLSMRRREIDTASLASVLLRYPLPTLRVLAGIYAQALRLVWKKVPYYPHPASGDALAAADATRSTR